MFERLQSQGRAPLRACLEALTPPLSTQRRSLAQSAFSRLDVDGLNRVAPQSLIAAFDPSRHPDVISGKQSTQDAVDDLLAAFSGSASVEDFCDYHCAVGAISDDVTYERFVRNAWRTSHTESNRAAGASSPQRGRKVIQGGTATGGPSLPGKSTPLRRRRGASPAPRVDTGVTTVVEKLRESVLFNGARGIAQLERSLRDEASDSSRDLTFEELSRACRSLGLSSQELRLLFDACDADGWFKTGDVATISSTGALAIRDRAKDVVKSGGEWISSAELEGLVRRFGNSFGGKSSHRRRTRTTRSIRRTARARRSSRRKFWIATWPGASSSRRSKDPKQRPPTASTMTSSLTAKRESTPHFLASESKCWPRGQRKRNVAGSKI